MLGQVIGAVGLLLAVFGLIIAAWDMRRRVNKLSDENERLQTEMKTILKREVIGEQRVIGEDVNLIAGATEELWLLGINALGPLHQGREAVINLLKRKGKARVLLLDPTCPAFAKREGDEESVDGRITGRLRAEYEASVAICRDIVRSAAGGDALQVKTHSQYPTEALVFADPRTGRGMLHVNIYPDAKGTRGSSGEHRRVPGRTPYADEFQRWVTRYETLWSGASPVELT